MSPFDRWVRFGVGLCLGLAASGCSEQAPEGPATTRDQVVIVGTTQALTHACVNNDAPSDRGRLHTVYYDVEQRSFYVCRDRRLIAIGVTGEPGANGRDGAAWLAVVSSAASTVCSNGGVTVQVGPDQNRDGILAASEVQSTASVCNGRDGADGEDGEDGVNGVDGVDGENGVDGEDGVDGADGEDGEDGEDGASGVPGFNALIAQVVEQPGDHCDQGGVRIESGQDLDRDGALDPNEVTSTSFLCGGVPSEEIPTGVPTPPANHVGTRFVVTFPDHLCASEPNACDGETTRVTLTIVGTGAISGSVTHAGNTTPFAGDDRVVVSLDSSVLLATSEVVEHNAVIVDSDVPVTVYGMVQSANSADGFLALPVTELGSEHYAMSYPSDFAGSQFAIAAVENGTQVTIVPTVAGRLAQPNVPLVVNLDAGDTFLYATRVTAGDVTGSHIVSSQPIAFFSGHRCARVPTNTGFCDYMVEQIPDVTRWGTSFRMSPFAGQPRYRLRVLAARDGTTITGAFDGPLSPGAVREEEFSFPVELIASQPVLVAAFMLGMEDAGMGDPSLVILPPQERYVDEATFSAEALGTLGHSNVKITALTSRIDQLRLDGAVLPAGAFRRVSGGAWSIADIPVSSGVHQLEALDPAARFSALVYGYGPIDTAVSYAYPAGGIGHAIDPQPTAEVRPVPCGSVEPGVECDTLVANGTGASAELDFCILQFPASLTLAASQSDDVFGRVLEDSVTDGAGENPIVDAQVGWGPAGSDPTREANWHFFPAEFNNGSSVHTLEDEYVGRLQAPATAGTYAYTMRFTMDGHHWTYCDLDGAGSPRGLTFLASQLGTLTVTP